MNSYYFTFGQDHYTLRGIPMRHSWVRVVASSWETARRIFVEKFTRPVMQKPDRWAFQYDSIEFSPAFYPMGEYRVIHELPETPAPAPGHTLCVITTRPGSQDVDFSHATRESVLEQLQLMKRMGYASQCTYRLDGSIEISLTPKGGAFRLGGYYSPVPRPNPIQSHAQ